MSVPIMLVYISIQYAETSEGAVKRESEQDIRAP
jgi:hypothetical protein